METAFWIVVALAAVFFVWQGRKMLRKSKESKEKGGGAHPDLDRYDNRMPKK